MFNRPRFVTHLQQISIEPLDFPVFSVTQTLISVTQEIIREHTLHYKRYLSRKFRLPGFFYRSGAFQFNLIISNIRKSSENIPNIRNQELDCRNRSKSTAENRKMRNSSVEIRQGIRQKVEKSEIRR